MKTAVVQTSPAVKVAKVQHWQNLKEFEDADALRVHIQLYIIYNQSIINIKIQRG